MPAWAETESSSRQDESAPQFSVESDVPERTADPERQPEERLERTTAEPEDMASPTPAPEPEDDDPDRPKRSGWWQRRSFFRSE